MLKKCLILYIVLMFSPQYNHLFSEPFSFAAWQETLQVRQHLFKIINAGEMHKLSEYIKKHKKILSTPYDPEIAKYTILDTAIYNVANVNLSFEQSKKLLFILLQHGADINTQHPYRHKMTVLHDVIQMESKIPHAAQLVTLLLTQNINPYLLDDEDIPAINYTWQESEIWHILQAHYLNRRQKKR